MQDTYYICIDFIYIVYGYYICNVDLQRMYKIYAYVIHNIYICIYILYTHILKKNIYIYIC